MRHDSLPTNLVMVPNPPETMGEKSTAISMDLSARQKIVIHHRLGAKNPTLPVKQQTLSRTVSIFKRKQEPKPEACPSVEGTSGSQDPGFTMIAKSPQSPHPIIRPSKKGILLKGPRIEKRVKRKSVTQSTMSSPRSPLSREIKITTVDSLSSSPTSTSPHLPMPAIDTLRPDQSRPSQYAAEYERCGCTSDGCPPCRRCKLMLLSDRFCDLVNLQCAKWKL